MLTTLSHAELEKLSPQQLRRRVRQAKQDMHDRAVRAVYGMPDYPTAKANLEQAVFRYEDASAALDRLERQEAQR